ncbi:unnamed protein product [Protopolystoma xenopodis]|uniref:Uncharacterized protein n=1 Tax=Protopolystoma xenopodis TaxID=117903 RepID=A0A448XCK1_9PLAT|nr:unnamed protein product [Protopolystoma xenopodis]
MWAVRQDSERDSRRHWKRESGWRPQPMGYCLLGSWRGTKGCGQTCRQSGVSATCPRARGRPLGASHAASQAAALLESVDSGHFWPRSFTQLPSPIGTTEATEQCCPPPTNADLTLHNCAYQSLISISHVNYSLQ